MILLHLKADNDRNGNPRRCFVVLDSDGQPIDCIDENYSGDRDVRDRYPAAVQGPSIRVSAGEYRSWINSGEWLRAEEVRHGS